MSEQALIVDTDRCRSRQMQQGQPGYRMTSLSQHQLKLKLWFLMADLAFKAQKTILTLICGICSINIIRGAFRVLMLPAGH